MLKRLVTLLLLVTVAIPLKAQDDLRLRHINTKGYYIRSIYCDVNGMMWFGTLSGLVSLPQLESRSPRDYDRSFSGVNSCIVDISGDVQGRLWMKTANNEATSYVPQENRFMPAPEEMFAAVGINVKREYFVEVNENGSCCIWKDDKVFLMDEGGIAVDSLEMSGLIRKTGISDSTLAVLTEYDLVLVSLEKKRKERVTDLSPEDRKGMFKDMLVDGFNNVWLWKYDRIFKYDYAGDVFECFVTVPSVITDMVIDGQGRLWVSTHDSGIFIYDEQGTLLRHLHHSSMDPNGLQNDRIERIYYEKDSRTIWIAYTKGGLSVWDPEYTDFRPETIVDRQEAEHLTDVLSFACSSDGGMWVGLEDRGIYFVEDGVKSCVLDEGSVVDIYRDVEGTVWGGLYRNGLVRLGPDGTKDVFFKGKSPYAVSRDEEGYIWVALLGEGIWTLDPVTGETEMIDDRILYARDMECRGNDVYVASTDGCHIISREGVSRAIYDGYAVDMCMDRMGYVWITGGEVRPGLTVIPPQGEPAPVLPEILDNRPLMGVTEDPDGNIWVLSSSTLFLLQRNPAEDGGIHVSEFDINPEGFQINYNNKAVAVDDNGILWIGTTSGYQCIDTGQFLDPLAHVRDTGLYLGAVSINDEIISPGQRVNGRVLIDRDIVYVDRLELNYNENNLIVECSKPHDAIKTSETYYYNLKGLSDKWFPIKDGTIVLSNLPTGNFRLMVCTKSSDVSQLLEIRVSPPFWKSWWANLIYLILAGAALVGIRMYSDSRKSYQMRLRELQMQQEQESRMNELKLQFFTNISHDLRTPLSLIIDPIDEIIRQTDKSEHQSVLLMVQRNAEHLLALVNQILDFRRLEFGREKLMLSYGDVVSYVSDIMSSFRIKAEKEDIRMMFIPLETRIDTMFDKDKTRKILMNLLSNAFKFTESGGYIHVQIGVSDGNVAVTVKDSGTGISDEDKEHIFERFYQAPNARKQSDLGSGVGLHIVREYVRLQGGDITVEDNPDGRGSLFRFTLPLNKRQIVNTEEEVTADEQVKEHEMTILVVEDNKDMLEYISGLLSSEYDIVVAGNGAEALDQISSHDVDIVISDIMMPEIDGMELCRRIKNDITNSHIPVILLTAKSLSSDELAGLEAGADDYITKPFSITILRQRIHNIIERTKQHHHRFATEVNVEPSEITITSLDEIFITKAIAVVEKHMDEPDFSVEDFSVEMGIHRSQLYKKLLHLTGKKPLQFIRLLRLKRGKQLLEKSGMYVSEVAYKTGFNSPRFFSKYFKEEFGITPKEFQSSIGGNPEFSTESRTTVISEP